MTVDEEKLSRRWNLKAYVLFIMLLYFQMLQRLLSSVAVHDLIMNPEMNDNDRKTHSKTIAMAGIGFLLIADGIYYPVCQFWHAVSECTARGQRYFNNCSHTF